MPTYIDPPQANFKLVDPGSYVARLYRFVHMGHIENDYQGKVSFPNKAWFVFELPTELHEFKEGEPKRPFSVSVEYSLSLGDKSNLKPLVEAMVGKLTEEAKANFDAATLIGKTCLLNIGVNAKGTWNKVISAAPVPKGMEVPKAVNASETFEWHKFTQGSFDRIPKYLMEKMQTSDEYRDWESQGSGTSSKVKVSQDEITVEDIPF